MKPRAAAWHTAMAALALAAVLPALSQQTGFSGPAPWSSRPASREASRIQGRFVVLGGEFGELSHACVSCHGLDGTADPSGAFPRLANQGESYLYGTLRDFATGARHSEVMTPIARELTDRDARNVAAYYAGLAPQPYPEPVGAARTGLVAQGRRLAATGAPKDGVAACSTCHAASGPRPPLSPALGGQFESYLDAQLEHFKAGERGDPSGVMPTIASALSRQQIRAVATYYASLTPAPGSEQAAAAREKNAALENESEGETDEGNRGPRSPERPHLGATRAPSAGGRSVLPGASSTATSTTARETGDER